MPKIGIIAEFNPFHQGHMYLMDYARNTLGASSIIIALGHEFTQRGDVALLDRYTRARSARSCGADLVLGMPVAASCGSAEVFARCGASLLSTAGCDTILCGWEGNDALQGNPRPDCSSLLSREDEGAKDLLFEIARILSKEPPEYKRVLSGELKSGKSFPSARTTALLATLSSNKKRSIAKGLLSSPNNILALEYARAILDLSLDLKLELLPRKGSAYHSSELRHEVYASASAIRQKLSSMESALHNETDFLLLQSLSSYMPAKAYRFLEDAAAQKLLLYPSDVDVLLHARLLEERDNRIFADCSSDLSNRISRSLDQYTGYEAFADLLKNKSLTRSRICRVLTHILLGIKEEDVAAVKSLNYAPYFHVLAASKEGRSLMGQLKATRLPLFCSINELSPLFIEKEPAIKRLLSLDMKASDMVRILRIQKSKMPLPTEYTRKVEL